MHIRTPKAPQCRSLPWPIWRWPKASIRRTDLARTLYVVADADKYDPNLDLENPQGLAPRVNELVWLTPA